VTGGGTGIDRHRYGSRTLWTLHDDLAGGFARRFADQVDLFFRSGEAALVVDVRRIGLVDSVGAAALIRCRDAHPGLRVVGRPAGWDDLTFAVRRSLLVLGALPDLETALGPATRSPANPEQRRHPRIPLQLPVELLFGGKCVPAALQDISRGGVQLTLIHERCLDELLTGESCSILGLIADPLSREIAGELCVEPVPMSPVRAAAPSGLGASFFGTPPPV
jgi:hypothetical protein